MADIKVERRSQNSWMPWLALALALALALIVATAMRMQPVTGGGGGGPMIAYHGQSWQPMGPELTQTIPDASMKQVGMHQGRMLCTNKAMVPGGGGGGRQMGMSMPNTPAYGRLYLRMGPNNYEPLRPVR